MSCSSPVGYATPAVTCRRSVSGNTSKGELFHNIIAKQQRAVRLSNKNVSKSVLPLNVMIVKMNDEPIKEREREREPSLL